MDFGNRAITDHFRYGDERTTPACDREAYKQRNVMERCFNHLKQWRRTATRYDKRPTPADQPSPSPHS
ncbi:hypothetical protein [Streptomyces halstedii]|uniref:hypothetical protein n=1 Tax=Streptomyces halstedii TaxID=1944 RepID=UPI003460B299